MKSVPYGHQTINARDVREVLKAVSSDWITQGPRVARFEQSLREYCGAKYAVAVANGTAALHIACLAAGLHKGDEAVTSPITFLASANAVLYAGATPRFADVEPETANVSRRSLERALTQKTKAVIPVHYAGHSCDMTGIAAAARKRGLVVIEDAAHALGGRYKGTVVGSCAYSDMTIFSFHPVKSITTGEGGAVMTNDEALYRKLLMLRSHGISRDFVNESHGEWYYEMQDLGFNYRITDMQCALGISQMSRLDRFVGLRKKIVAAYGEAFGGNPFFELPVEKGYAESSWHLYPIRLKKRLAAGKREIFSALRKAGVGAQVHYIPVYLQPYYRALGFSQGLCPEAERFYQSEISLPIFPGLTGAQQKFVIAALLRICEEAAG